MLETKTLKKNGTLQGKDLEEIGCQSLRCKMSIGELILLLTVLNIKFTKKQIETIREYRQFLQKITRSAALGY